MDEQRRTGRIASAFVRFIGGLTTEEVADRLREATDETAAAERRAFAAGFREAEEMSGNDEPVLYTSDGKPIGTGYRQITAGVRDLSGLSQERAIAASYRLWNANPLAKALTEIPLDYVIGDGAQVQVYDDDLAELIEGFWEDPVNDFDGEGMEQITRELGLFGEQILLAFVRTGEDVSGVADGRLRLGPVDPAQIAAIVTDKENRKDVLAVRLKDENGSLTDGPLYKVIKPMKSGGAEESDFNFKAWRDLVDKVSLLGDYRISENAKDRHGVRRTLKAGQEWNLVEASNDSQVPGKSSPKKGNELSNAAFEGACFLFQINKLSTGVRGRPDLLPMIDWLDRYDQLFFDGAEHVGLLNTFVWDLEVQGGTEDAKDLEQNLRFQARKVQSAKSNSIFAHNERTTLEAKNPDLKTPDMQTVWRAMRVFIAGGARIPEHWIAEGGYTNRATAKEMGQPTFKMLTRRQMFVKGIFTRITQFQIDIWVGLGLIDEMVTPRDEDGVASSKSIPARDAFDIVFPDINVSDTVSVSQALANVAQAAFQLYSTNMLPLKPALEMIAAVAQMLGVDFDIDRAMESLEFEGNQNKAMADILAKMKSQNGKDQPQPQGETETETE